MSRLLTLAVFCLAILLAASADGQPVSFRKEIAPLLIRNCLACHGPKKAEGGYRVDSFQRINQGGDSGEPAVVAKKTDDSEIFRRISSEDPEQRMPLESDPLSQDQIALVRRWIAQGADYDADDPKLPLSRIVPPPVHPDAPEIYRSTLPVTALEFSPGGDELFVSGYHELTVWNPADGNLIRRIGNVGQRTYRLAFSPDGKILAVASGTPGSLGEVRLLDPSDGKLLRVLASTSDVVFDVSFHPAGDRIAVVAADGTLRVLDVDSGQQHLEITSHSDWVSAVAWSDAGDRIATASRDKTAKVFDASSGELIVTYNGHGNAVAGVAFHSSGNEVYSSAADKRIHLWKIADGAKSADVGSFAGELYKLSGGDGFLIAVSADKTARQYDRKSHKEIRKYTGHADWVLSSSYHGKLGQLATGSFDGEVRVWSMVDGKLLTNFLAAPGLPTGN